MLKTPQGREYPSPGERVPNRKEKKRLDARIKAWESMPATVRGKENGFAKPGSYRK